MEQKGQQPAWMKKMGIVTGALLMGLGGFLLWKKDPNVNRTLAIFMTVYGAFRMGMAIYQMKNPPADTPNETPTDTTL
ncbi:MAG: hypothetical protein FGM54_10230 [Chitinophagaceae bacterium]|nr:hypothetical protein [Chitinophagaceae bacterium]